MTTPLMRGTMTVSVDKREWLHRALETREPIQMSFPNGRTTHVVVERITETDGALLADIVGYEASAPWIDPTAN
jgi:hypothetical protein